MKLGVSRDFYPPLTLVALKDKVGSRSSTTTHERRPRRSTTPKPSQQAAPLIDMLDGFPASDHAPSTQARARDAHTGAPPAAYRARSGGLTLPEAAVGAGNILRRFCKPTFSPKGVRLIAARFAIRCERIAPDATRPDAPSPGLTEPTLARGRGQAQAPNPSHAPRAAVRPDCKLTASALFGPRTRLTHHFPPAPLRFTTASQTPRTLRFVPTAAN